MLFPKEWPIPTHERMIAVPKMTTVTCFDPSVLGLSNNSELVEQTGGLLIGYERLWIHLFNQSAPHVCRSEIFS